MPDVIKTESVDTFDEKGKLKINNYLSFNIKVVENGFLICLYGYDREYNYIASTEDEAKKIVKDLMK